MKQSTDRILTTHTGSLPRPESLLPLLVAENAGESVDRSELDTHIRQAVADTVRKQVEAGVDIINDGEMGKISYSTYVSGRLTGFENRTPVQMRPRNDSADFPDYAEHQFRQGGAARVPRYACTGPVRYTGHDKVKRDIENLKAAAQGVNAAELFMTAASPGVIAYFQPNRFYGSDEQYMQALAEAMREEYELIWQAGILLQVDCPDFTGLSSGAEPGKPPRDLGLRIEALNHAVARIPPDRMRLHLCWGNYEGPHHTDVPLRDILGEVLKARPAGISFEGANPRHEHEWKVFEQTKLPEGRVIIPGVLDSTTNYIEHPELVAQRIVRYAGAAGRENVIAGSDCGFGTFAGPGSVFPTIVYAKLKAMAEGARLASQELWK
jgi:5-methyltetrahydropteroyltriglutamate--homocysteine methyltransferase